MQLQTGYTSAQVEELLKKAQQEGKQIISMNTFYRLAQEGYIEKTLPEGRVREALYNPEHVHDIIKNGTPSKQRRRERLAQKQQQKSREQGEDLPIEKVAASDWILEGDLSSVFQLDLDLYGLDNAVAPTVTGTWWRKNPHACGIVFDKNNRRDIWGILSIIPMDEATIQKLLMGSLQEKDITTDDILAYEPGHAYSCYIPSVAIRPQHTHAFPLLLNQFTKFWCDRYPDIVIKKLYAFVDEGSGTGMHLISKLYFAPRYDLGEGAWELRLDRLNPSRIIQGFQRCLQHKASDHL